MEKRSKKQGIPRRGKTKEFKKNKERKDRVLEFPERRKVSGRTSCGPSLARSRALRFCYHPATGDDCRRATTGRFGSLAFAIKIGISGESVENPLTIYRGLSGPPGPKPRKSLKKVSPGTPESLEKVSKKSGESGKRLEKVPKDFFGTFSRLSGSRGRRPRETFFRLFRGFGPGGPERLL